MIAGTLRWLAACMVACWPAVASSQAVWRALPGPETTRIAAAQWSDAAIVGRCDAGVLTVFILQGGRLAEPSAFVMLERRGDQPTGGYWRVSTDGRSAFASSPEAVLRTLRKGGTLDVVIKSRQAPDQEMTLDLPVDGALVDGVLNACGAFLDAPAETVGSVVWADPPKPQASDFPLGALSDNLSGQAAVQCRARADGRVNCIVADEAPPGYQFGAHAVAIAERGAVRLSEEKTDALQGRLFTVRIPFNINGRQPAPTLTFFERIEAEARPLLTPEIAIR